MASNVLVGDTISIEVTFRDWSQSEDAPIVDPASVEVDILDEFLVSSAVTETATKVADGVYSFVWTPSVVGTFYVEFTGYYASGTVTKVREEFNVTLTPTTSLGDVALGEEVVLEFATDITPLYIDPEEMLVVYPDATLMEIAEIIHRFSLEVQAIFGTEQPSSVALEYIRAATLCALSNVHDASVAGMELALGDLRIAEARSNLIKGTPTNPCELAQMLQRQLKRVGMRWVVKGGAYPNPMPKRVFPYHQKELKKRGYPSL